MELGITVNGKPWLTAYLNDDVKVEFGGGTDVGNAPFSLTATYPTRSFEEIRDEYGNVSYSPVVIPTGSNRDRARG